MESKLKYKGIALISSTLFFVYSQISFGLFKANLLPYFFPVYDQMVYHSFAVLLLMWACIGRYEFDNTKLLKPITICFHITISYVFAELTGVSHGHFSDFGLWVFGIMLVVLIILTLKREKLKWSKKLRQHKYLYLFCAWMLTF